LGDTSRMAERFQRIEAQHRAFIERQHVFFTASAAAEGHVNLSPKGLDTLRVIDANTVCYLDLTGSGAETAAHSMADGRLTIMMCAFEGPPLILRLYGASRVLVRGGADYARVLSEAFGGEEPIGARAIVLLSVELVYTSCGYGVPHMKYVGERPSMIAWAEQKGEAGLLEYRRSKNVVSLDGLPTGLGGE